MLQKGTVFEDNMEELIQAIWPFSRVLSVDTLLESSIKSELICESKRGEHPFAWTHSIVCYVCSFLYAVIMLERRDLAVTVVHSLDHPDPRRLHQPLAVPPPLFERVGTSV